MDVTGIGPIAGRLDRVGEGWCLVSGAAQDWIVVIAAVGVVHGRCVTIGARAGLVAARQARVWVPRYAGSPTPGSAAFCIFVTAPRPDGVLRRVGADFVELCGAGDRIALVSFEALAAAQSR